MDEDPIVFESKAVPKHQYMESLLSKCNNLAELLDEVPVAIKKYDIRSFFRGAHTDMLNVTNWIDSLKDEYVIVKGHIQSGKSNFMICASNLLVFMGFNVVIVLRNNKADRAQFEENFNEFQQTHNELFNRSPIVSTVSSKKEGDIYLLLGNESNLSKTMDTLRRTKRPFAVFIDEVDAIDAGGECKRAKAVAELKEKAYCVFGVSGTVMDPLAKENVRRKNFITLKTPADYKGVFNNKIRLTNVINTCTLEDEYNHFSGRVSDDLFETTQLDSFIRHYTSLPAWSHHPRICLIHISKCVEPYKKIQEKVCEHYPDVMTLVYNGEGITRQMGADAFLYKKESIATVLQDIKTHSHVVSTILIFAGELASRGISFKSADRQWHLTDQFLLVAKTTDEPELVQKVRLCGRYQDDIPLTLYSTEKIIHDLRCAYFRQEEIIMKAKEGRARDYCKNGIEEMEISKSKKTSRSMTKDSQAVLPVQYVNRETGIPMCVYKGNGLVPDETFAMYGMDAPEREHVEQPGADVQDTGIQDERLDTCEIYVTLDDVSGQTKETYELILEFFADYHDGWTERATISKYLQENGHGNVDRINARFEHLIAKGRRVSQPSSLVFKKDGARWKVRQLK
jgi:hypothetical protein